MRREPDYYLVLGVSPGASSVEIEKAARALVEKFPKNAREPSVNAAYRQLLEAYEVLSNEEKRRAYDRQRAQRAPELLQITTQLSRHTIAALDSEQLLYLMVTLRAPDEPAQATLPLNLALVFDRSTSMRDERLAKLKAAAREIVHKLSPEDVLSIVSFSDRSEVIWSAANVEQRDRIVSHIYGVEASGGTEIYQGLKAGLRELSRSPLDRYINHLILLTDGHTYGDEDDCLALAQTASTKGFTISAFGIGSDWNDQFLDQIVAPSGGRAAYIEVPGQIVEFLREEINGLGAIYAHNVHLKLKLPAGTRSQYAFKLSPYSLPLDRKVNPIQLGTVERRAPLSILFELVISSQRVGATLDIPLEFVADIPSAQVRERSFRYEESISVSDAEAETALPPAIVKAVQMLNLYRLGERAWEEFEAGNTELATKRMAALTTRLFEAGYPDLAKQAEYEKERLRQLGTLSLEGRKRLKYGTRSLLTTALNFDNS